MNKHIGKGLSRAPSVLFKINIDIAIFANKFWRSYPFKKIKVIFDFF